ncbi:MAG: PLP-dependent aminotransferase family protein [Lachnospiraceae bacterium]|nr:PLP-dependent aminotransferase family protein [Lachnospiraceae bacterium]
MFDRINWEDRGRQPMYDYLYSVIRDRILEGTLRPGEKLPSKRTLSLENDIALITVENAYAQLIAEGYLESRERRGYFVSDQISILGSGGESADQPAPFEENDNEKKTPVIADFATGQIFEEDFPFATWAKLFRRVLSAAEPGLRNSPHPQGVPELREAIREYLQKSRGLSVSVDRIIVGPGTEYLHLILLQLFEDSAVVAVEDPGYKKIGQIYETCGHNCLHIPVDADGLRVECLEGQGVKLIHTSPSHHFPTGAIMPAFRRLDLIRYAQREGCYIIEDDYDSEFRFTGRPIPPLSAMDAAHVIYMNTFTRTLSPSVRIAYMVLPEALQERYNSELSFYAGSVSSIDQYALALFLQEGYYERHISRMRTHYKNQRRQFREMLEHSDLSRVAHLKEDPAGLTFLLEIPGLPENREKALVELLKERGILVRALTDYYYDAGKNKRTNASACLILNHASVRENEWEQAIGILKDTIKECKSETRRGKKICHKPSIGV